MRRPITRIVVKVGTLYGEATMSEDNGQDIISYSQIREDLNRRKPLLAATLAGNPSVLERVKEYEKQSEQVIQQTGLVAAKGEDIEQLALIDAVTELYNHKAYVKELKAEILRAARYQHNISVAMMIVDETDFVMEEYGKMTQDAVFKVVSRVIRSSIREVDLAARYAPFQFGLILPQTNSAMAALVAERIRERVASQVFSHNWENFSIKASFGISTYPRHGAEYEVLIAHAMEALEYAAERGGDRVFVF